MVIARLWDIEWKGGALETKIDIALLLDHPAPVSGGGQVGETVIALDSATSRAPGRLFRYGCAIECRKSVDITLSRASNWIVDTAQDRTQ